MTKMVRATATQRLEFAAALDDPVVAFAEEGVGLAAAVAISPRMPLR